MDLQGLSEDELYTAFAEADEAGNDELAWACAAEIIRRCGDRPVPTVSDAPAWLSWLPRAFWHQKPVGEGRG